MKLTFLFLIASFISSSMAATIPYTVTAASFKFMIGDETAPSLNFLQGNTYVFDISDASLTLHPFKLSTNANSGEYTNGVSSNATTVQIVVDSNTPSTLYYYCANHANMGADITVSPASCNSAYSTLGRTYDANAPACVIDGNNVVTSTSQCQCTGCGQIQVYMAEAGDKCNNGTWSAAVQGCTDSNAVNYNSAATEDDGSCQLNAMCNTFTCPSGYLLRPNPETIPCASNTCVGLAADHTDTSGTNYGQYAPKQDKDRCCYFDNTDFEYDEHSKQNDGTTWKNAAEGGAGCLSDKCYDKSQIHGHKVCGWSSGSCKSCGYCQSYEVTMPATSKFNDNQSNCDAAKCRRYLYDDNNQDIKSVCSKSSCRGCEYCTDKETEIKNQYGTCPPKCQTQSWRVFLQQSNARQEFCYWSACKTCQRCQQDINARETADNTRYEDGANCDNSKCSRMAFLYALDNTKYSKYANICLSSTCKKCPQCITEKKAEVASLGNFDTTATCGEKCLDYVVKRHRGSSQYDSVCYKSVCKNCGGCVAETNSRELEKTIHGDDKWSDISGCDKDKCSRMSFLYSLDSLTYSKYANICLSSSCKKCPQCIVEKKVEVASVGNFDTSATCHEKCLDYAVKRKKESEKTAGSDVYDNVCYKTDCKQCGGCVTENNNKKAQFVGEGCESEICSRWSVLSQIGRFALQYNGYCSSRQCQQCSVCSNSGLQSSHRLRQPKMPSMSQTMSDWKSFVQQPLPLTSVKAPSMAEVMSDWKALENE